MNAEGGHGFWAQLAHNDNTSFQPAVLSAVSVNLIGAYPH